MMTSKKIQIVHVNLANDKTVIAQSTHNTTTCPMTRKKAKSTIVPLTKLVSKHTHLLKFARIVVVVNCSSP